MKPICVKIDGCSYGEYLKVVGTMVADLGGELHGLDVCGMPKYAVIDSDKCVYYFNSLSEAAFNKSMKGYELMTPQEFYAYVECEVVEKMDSDIDNDDFWREYEERQEFYDHVDGME